MRKLFHKLHHIPSILLGLPIFILCLTGTILLFEEDIARVQNPSLYSVEQGVTPLSIEEVIDKVSSGLGVDKEITKITTDDATTPYLVSIKGSKWKYAVNQYTGEVLGERKMSKFFMGVLYTHRFLLDKPDKHGGVTVGKMAVAISTIFCIVILISGLVIWIPKTAKAIKHRVRISVTKGWKRFWYDTHVAGGFYVSIIVLIICLTGLYWSFGGYREGLLSIVTSPEREQMVVQSAKAASQMVDGIIIVDATIELPQSGHSIIKSIHTGTWGGSFSKWFYALAMIIATSLPITGYWLWLKKKKNKAVKKVISQ